MNYRVPFLVFALSVLALRVPSALAQTDEGYLPEGHTYAHLNANYVLDPTTGDDLNGFGLSPRLGYDVNRCWGLELESGWIMLEGKSLRSGGSTRNIHEFPLLLNLNLRRPRLFKSFVPYISGGLGAFFFAMDEDRKGFPGEAKIEAVELGGKTAIGGDYYLSNRFAVNLESGYYFIHNPRVTAFSSTNQDESFKLQAGGWYVGTGLKFRF